MIQILGGVGGVGTEREIATVEGTFMAEINNYSYLHHKIIIIVNP